MKALNKHSIFWRKEGGYLSRQRYPWWGYAKEILRRYQKGSVTDGEREAIEFAVGETKERPDGESRLALIDMVYFRGTHTLDGAAIEVNCSYHTAKRWQQQFLQLVAEKRGLFK